MTEVVTKGWGREIIFASTPNYCGKLMEFYRVGAKSSMHFHVKKHETWYVQKGKFRVNWINHCDATHGSHILIEGSTWTNEIGEPHQLEALEDNSVIFEVSTYDDPNDNYRVMPGDSQK